jgi:hypothetical protein
MKHFYIQTLLAAQFLGGAYIQAQSGSPTEAGARGLGMAGVGATFQDANSIFTNQAGTAFVEDISFTAFTQQRFLTGAVNTFAFGGILPNPKLGTFGLAVQYFGYEQYNEQKVGLSYARKLASNFSLGLQVDYLATRIPDYGMANNLTVELGFLYKINETVSVGGHVYNPIRAKLKSGDYLPTIFDFGLAYAPSKQLQLHAQVQKHMTQPLSARFGLEYSPIDMLALRVGVSTAPIQASFGVGVLFQGLRLDIASAYHQILGFSPGLSLGYAIQKQKASPAKAPNAQ